jgi:DNA-binding NarL/FixJ family response regulator
MLISVEKARRSETITDRIVRNHFALIGSDSLFLHDLACALLTVDKRSAVEMFATLNEWHESGRSRDTSVLVIWCKEFGLVSPGGSGRNLQSENSTASVPFVVLSECEDPEQTLRALRSGAAGYIPTTLPVEGIARALYIVRAGGIFIPASHFLALQNASGSIPSIAEGTVPFTADEYPVARAMSRGAPDKAIALELNLRISAVKVHARNVMKKLRAKNRTEFAMTVSSLFGASLS